MNRIELSGKSQGKGRNGYFQLHSVELMNIPTDPDGQVLNIDFYPRRRVNCVGPARLLLNLDDATKLAQFLGEAVESRPPVANIEHGELVCECGHRGTPRLEESGYQVSHALVEIVGDTIIASGWDGSSRAVSEDGDAYWLMCHGCGKLHPLPDRNKILPPCMKRKPLGGNGLKAMLSRMAPKSRAARLLRATLELKRVSDRVKLPEIPEPVRELFCDCNPPVPVLLA